MAKRSAAPRSLKPRAPPAARRAVRSSAGVGISSYLRAGRPTARSRLTHHVLLSCVDTSAGRLLTNRDHEASLRRPRPRLVVAQQFGARRPEIRRERALPPGAPDYSFATEPLQSSI